MLFIISELTDNHTKFNGQVTIEGNFEKDYANENSPKTILFKSRVGDEVCILSLYVSSFFNYEMKEHLVKMIVDIFLTTLFIYVLEER